MIQTLKTLKADPPEMVNLIYNISPTANDGKQHKDKHKDNSNNIIKYLELKEDKILCLSAKVEIPCSYGRLLF